MRPWTASLAGWAVDDKAFTAQQLAGQRQQLVAHLRHFGIRDERVLWAMEQVPRHLFVDAAYQHAAYEDRPLPIGQDQTISQPYIVARMTEALLGETDPPPARVLEISTGCGYQCAILALLVNHVYSIERLFGLLDQARRHLAALDIHNCTLRHGDGFAGWPEEAPFDGILVTAAPSSIPESLTAQLADGGRLVLPVGDVHQELLVVQRCGDTLQETLLEPVRFVPLLPGIA